MTLETADRSESNLLSTIPALGVLADEGEWGVGTSWGRRTAGGERDLVPRPGTVFSSQGMADRHAVECPGTTR
ncbi:hypothetical protein M407DRAFT_241583 [Tulasnella calospora MUT 4182]|uniref:Uncharacterized protein n=1 Tax=Tulasnella calospora MUT 4182 TaxID=1051891 RepID=A0A0C3LDG1_9AGAM|nr:hypothetical protein M407DRAFT_246891 [Tulasnella calospora MUT 4182]KIO16946.1 hypothetical protein M407DRAFT_246878 [Tulasnella calospora MUT 4182]KIO20759.1 hypothetical protein M407DRAFT_245690 [Tulasnella calospora MUT 4182]KIO31973.1 hypothetical protein M407DRAFT_241583 [Tulasnella calospora MUT 4182]